MTGTTQRDAKEFAVRKLLTSVFALILLIVIIVVGVFIYIDAIAKSAIERGATYALGVNTSLDSADVQVFQGQVELAKLNVSNPDGYASDHFLDLGTGNMRVTLGSLRQDVVHVPHLRLIGADINLEKKAGAANYQVILDNLKKLQGDQPREGKRFIIDELVIRDVDVHVDLLSAAGLGGADDLTRVTVPIDEVKLEDVGKQDGRGVTIGELSGLVLKAMLASAVEKGAGLIPDDVIGELRGKLTELANLDRLVERIDLGNLEKTARELGLPSDVSKDIGDRAQQELDKAKGKLGDLLGGDEKDEKK